MSPLLICYSSTSEDGRSSQSSMPDTSALNIRANGNVCLSPEGKSILRYSGRVKNRLKCTRRLSFNISSKI